MIKEVLLISAKDIARPCIVIILSISLIMLVLYEKPMYVGAKTESKAEVTYQVLGYSYQGIAINCCVVTPKDYRQTILITAAVHGFDDGWDGDGQALVEIAQNVFKAFASEPEALEGTRLMVIPCVNPDGAYYGKSSDGFGRCNAQGIDINRDFDYNWQYCAESRYQTGSAPFTTPEAQILRDIVLQEKPEIIIDLHGWLACTYGDAQIASYFDQSLGTYYKKRLGPPGDESYMRQFFTGWAGQYGRAVLVEFPPPPSDREKNIQEYSEATITAIQGICEGNR
ncbi:MAG TPA: M14 family metallopeptidase [Syntrophomonas sp.]|nr:M14 family metallopeptidase [Syntrophomonas sp.]